jgi:hypothetical protein
MQMLAGASSTPISNSKSKSISRSAKRKAKGPGRASKSVGPAIAKLASVLTSQVNRSDAPSQSDESKKREMDYRAEDDLRTLTRAEEVRSDPERMKHAGRKHREQLRTLQNAGRAFSGGRAARR